MSPTSKPEPSVYTSWAVHCLRAYAAYMVLLSVLPGTDPAESREAFSSAVGLAIWSMLVRRSRRGGQLLTLFVIFTRGVAAIVQLASGQDALSPSTYPMVLMTVLASAVLVMLRSERRPLALAASGLFALAIGYGCFDVVAHQEQRHARRVAYRDEVAALRKTCREASASDLLRKLSTSLTLPALPEVTKPAHPGRSSVFAVGATEQSWNGERLDSPEALAARVASLLPPEPLYLAIDADTPVESAVQLLSILQKRPLRVLVAGKTPLLGAPPAPQRVFVSGYRKAETDEARTQLLHAELARLTVRCPDALFVLAKPITSHGQLADDMLAGLENCPVAAVELEQLRFVLLTPLHGELATPHELALELPPGVLEHVTAESVHDLWRSLRAHE